MTDNDRTCVVVTLGVSFVIGMLIGVAERRFKQTPAPKDQRGQVPDDLLREWLEAQAALNVLRGMM